MSCMHTHVTACRLAVSFYCKIAAAHWRKLLWGYVLEQGQPTPPLFLEPSEGRVWWCSRWTFFIWRNYNVMLTGCWTSPHVSSKNKCYTRTKKKKKTSGEATAGCFPSVCSGRGSRRLLCAHGIMIYPFVHVSMGHSAHLWSRCSLPPILMTLEMKHELTEL